MAQLNSQKKTQKTDEMPKAYDAKQHEDLIYKAWEEKGLFQPKAKKGGKSFSIIMPPPNATGTLHLGHAVMLALEDIMTRYHRMKGDTTLWLPGTDHAAIATQNKVEKLLSQKGITRFDLGRKDFLKEVAVFVKDSQNTIRNQIRKMGSSCDWTRETYTLDEGPTLAMRTVFKRMYDDGLIYRGHRTVNWCTRCQSTLADDEVNYKEEKGKLYTFKYSHDFPIEIATTRPETKLGDVAVAVHPDDKRYKKYVGKRYNLEFAGDRSLTIDIIADASIDASYGTGAVGITPAHSHVDYEIYTRHGGAKKFTLPHNVINEQGVIASIAHSQGMKGKYDEKSVKEARQAIAQYLEEQGLIKKIEDITHNIGICYRCGTVVETILSDQWFVNVDKKIPKRNKSIKQLSIEAVKSKKIKILPEKFEKIYFHWMNDLHDWCISRQVWFGHQIPVWYCKNCGSEKGIVGIETPERCPSCKGTEIYQDSDTLDTWFSSGMWTFSTLGWPKKTKDLATFHPTSVLETGYDILFFWVARMIIMSTYALNEVPFKTVYLHGLVRTRNGEKMSKSKQETCIDPLDMIEKYGADALRVSMVIGGGPGNDIRLYEEKIAGYRNFVNKIWNATRFILLNTTEEERNVTFKPSHIKTTSDKWIISKLNKLIKSTTKKIEAFQFSEAGEEIYTFLWNDICDWYVELSKGKEKNSPVLIYALKTVLKLLHPFVPFVTEALWEILGESSFIMEEKWPTAIEKRTFAKEEKLMEHLQELIAQLRKVRAEYHIDPAKKMQACVRAGKLRTFIEEKSSAIQRLGNLESLELVSGTQKIPHSLHIVTKGLEIFLPAEGLFDMNKEKERIAKEVVETGKEYEALQQRLQNEGFVKSAPKQVVDEAREKAQQLQEKLKKLDSHIRELENL